MSDYLLCCFYYNRPRRNTLGKVSDRWLICDTSFLRIELIFVLIKVPAAQYWQEYDRAAHQFSTLRSYRLFGLVASFQCHAANTQQHAPHWKRKFCWLLFFFYSLIWFLRDEILHRWIKSRNRTINIIIKRLF